MILKKRIERKIIISPEHGYNHPDKRQLAREYETVIYKLSKGIREEGMKEKFPNIKFPGYFNITQEQIEDKEKNLVTICTGIISSSNVSLTVVSKLIEIPDGRKKYETRFSNDIYKFTRLNDTLYSNVTKFFDEMYGIKQEVKK